MRYLIALLLVLSQLTSATLTPKIVLDVCYEGGKLGIDCGKLSNAMVFVFTDDKKIGDELYYVCNSVCNGKAKYNRTPNTAVFTKKED